MDFQEFKMICENKDQKFDDLILQSLYLIKQNEWEKSHNIAQDIYTNFGSIVHGLLHRIEGDDWNAKYWFSQGSYSGFHSTIDQEWDNIADKYFNSLCK